MLAMQDNTVPNILELERPTSFAAVVGQDKVVEALQERIRDERSLDRHLAFVGAIGAGKMTLARLFAQALICERPQQDGSPCQTCDECKGVIEECSWAYLSIDVAEQDDEEEAVRTLVERDSKLNTARVRVLSFENAERLTPSATDVALKTLEKETKTVFIFLVNEEARFSAALRSRCQVFQLRPVEADVLIEHLSKVCKRHGLEHEEAALTAIAQASQGQCGRAMGTLARVATLGAVVHSTTLVELGLDWGQAMLDCWSAIFAGQPDEGLRKFEALGADGPSRIRAMQAFILALAMRHELPGESYPPIGPALEALPEEAWVGVITEWESFAASRSMKTTDLIQQVSDFWRVIRLDTPWQLAFRRSFEDLAPKSYPSQGRGGQGVAAEQ